MNDDRQDSILGLLGRLPQAAPSPLRTELVRARALLALEKGHQQRIAAPRRSPGERVVDGALYFACAVYIVAAALEAMKLGWPLR